MSKIPKQVYLLKNNIVFVVALAVWVMLFAIVYSPSFGLTPEGPDYAVVPYELRQWYQLSSTCIPLLCAILVLVVAISRLVMWLTTRTNRMTEFEYLLWQVGEYLIFSLFADLFLSLMFQVSFFSLLSNILVVSVLTLFIPYTVYWLYVEKKEKELRLAEASDTIAELRRGLDRSVSESGTIKFVDEKGNVRLIVNKSLVYTVEAAGNYVTILYENNGRLTRFALRNTLKSIEELCNAHGIVRCHRSWFVNLAKIRLLRHDPDGVYAEIDGEGIPDIPVSKNYASLVIQKLSAE